METLLIGNTGYVTRKFVERAFPDSSVVVMGNEKLKTDKTIQMTSYPFAMEDGRTGHIVRTRSFKRVVYFSNYLTLHGERQGEVDEIRKLFHTYQLNKDAEVIYLTSVESCYTDMTGKTKLVKDAEDLCLFYAETLDIQMKVIRIPFLYSAEYEDDYICRLIHDMEDKDEIWLSESKENPAYFMSMDDLGELLYRVFDSWDGKTEVLNVPDIIQVTFRDLTDRMMKLNQKLCVNYTGKSEAHEIPPNDKVLRHKYGWFQKDSIVEDIVVMYENYQQKKQKLREQQQNRFVRWLRKHDKIVKVTELLVGFVCMEGLCRTAGNSAQFRMIDFRLLYIVLLGGVHGMNIGIAASVLAGGSLVWAYAQEGRSWLTLFYEPMNWVPFIAYLTVGVVCGYVKLRNRDKVRFVKHENALLLEKYLTLKNIYMETLENQKTYKKQIVGRRDSFGKIFKITRKLDVLEPQEVFEKAIEVLEEVLDNQTIAVYSIRKDKQHGRLEACSKNYIKQLPQFFSTEKYEKTIESAMKGSVWVNRKLVKDYPMYMAGLHGTEEYDVLIMVCRTSYDQKGLYYANLIKIICGLIESSLLRAMRYQQLIRNNTEQQGEE